MRDDASTTQPDDANAGATGASEARGPHRLEAERSPAVAPAGRSRLGVAASPSDADEREDDAVSSLVEALLQRIGRGEHRGLYRQILDTVVRLAADDAETLDLKITAAALGEMAEAFRVFRPYRGVKKATFFGSARTRPDDPLYQHARALAERLAGAGWMVVTGAGPGIMQAAMEGAGRERSLGVNIRLPLEQGANAFIAHDPKLVEMRYFFTRKLMLMKESDGYVVLPGGFGTLDEAFELLTLLQTGKAEPAPLVLLDVAEGGYWAAWERFLEEDVLARGLVSPEDRSLYRITSSVEVAAAELLGFYANYHSCRWVGDLLVIRLRRSPTRDQLAALNERFADLATEGGIRFVRPLPPERSSRDHLELPRVALRFNRASFGRLRELIDALNALVRPVPEDPRRPRVVDGC
jgi:uncharacterized protein (TIGR00730 family)